MFLFLSITKSLFYRRHFLECDNASLRREHRNFTAIAFKSLANHFANHNTIRRRKIASRNKEQRVKSPSFKVSIVFIFLLKTQNINESIQSKQGFLFQFRPIRELPNPLQILLEMVTAFFAKTLPRFVQVNLH